MVPCCGFVIGPNIKWIYENELKGVFKRKEENEPQTLIDNDGQRFPRCAIN